MGTISKIIPCASALPALVFSTYISVASAHHGVAGVGAGGLEGPGSPIESATSAVLPEDSLLVYYKFDEARYRTYSNTTPNLVSSQYSMVGLGYGVTPWFSVYSFLPYNAKYQESGGQNSQGVADMSLLAQVGFTLNDGFKLIPKKESLDDLEDWHYSIFVGGTVPTGNANYFLGDGTIDPSMSLGFGNPSYTVGLTGSKIISPKWTLNLELSTLAFSNFTYANGDTVQFGQEKRLNTALTYAAWAAPEHKFRIDPVIEAQFLSIGRDTTNYQPDMGSGGQVVYIVPGARIYWGKSSFAVGVKTPVWNNLNESAMQQGSEGLELYRLIFSASYLF